MKYTLLELVQRILASMNSDEVNSINDTEESSTVAKVVEESYFDLINRTSLPEHYDYFELTSAGVLTPTVMELPNLAVTLHSVKYNNQLTGEDAINYKDVRFKPVDQFFDDMYDLALQEENTGGPAPFGVVSGTLTIATDSIPIAWRDDKFPEWYTTYNDNTVIFDSYNVEEDASLQKNKTVCYGVKRPNFSLTDSFIPDLDAHLFPLLLQESKSQAFVELKQMENGKAEQRARRNWISLQHKKDRFNPTDYSHLRDLPNYGRKHR